MPPLSVNTNIKSACPLLVTICQRFHVLICLYIASPKLAFPVSFAMNTVLAWTILSGRGAYLSAPAVGCCACAGTQSEIASVNTKKTEAVVFIRLLTRGIGRRYA
jgi:hypothetical protein